MLRCRPIVRGHLDAKLSRESLRPLSMMHRGKKLVGRNKIVLQKGLKQKAQTALGPKFDFRAFHDVILDSGALPMDVLERRVDDWIATQKK